MEVLILGGLLCCLLGGLLCYLSTHESKPTGTLSWDELGMLKSGEFADAEVECRGRTWAVHKVIVCGRSQWFNRAFRGKFKEATDSKVVIHDEDPDHIDWLLRYIYGGGKPLLKLHTHTHTYTPLQ